MKEKVGFVRLLSEKREDEKNVEELDEEKFDEYYSQFSKNYLMPDGDIEEVGKQTRLAPEWLLFNPESIGSEEPSLHEAIIEVISGFADNLHQEFYTNIMLAGGVSQTKGLATRLQEEIELAIDKKHFVKVSQHKNSHYIEWIGASLLARNHEERFFENYNRKLKDNLKQ